MKKIFYCCLIVFFTILSCDSVTTEHIDTIPSENETLYSKTNVMPASNSANPFDTAGEIHNEIVEAYIGGTASIPRQMRKSLLESIAISNTDFAALENNYFPVDTLEIKYYLQNENEAALEVMLLTPLSSTKQDEFLSFIRQVALLQQQGSDYSAVYSYIADYESSVKSNNAINANGKKFILTITSLVRHAMNFAKKQKQKPRDRDWDVSVACIIAGVAGGLENTQQAIAKMLVAEIMLNE